jgi:hypothetical protein
MNELVDELFGGKSEDVLFKKRKKYAAGFCS